MIPEAALWLQYGLRSQVACVAVQRQLRLVCHSCALDHILEGYRPSSSYTTMPIKSIRRMET